jgi:IS5 family transposase
MYKKDYTQLTIGENLLYQNLPDDILAKLNRLINWKPFENILSKLHPSTVGRPAYNPLLMLKILIIQQIYGHSDPEMEIMLHGNLFYRRFLGLSATDPVPDHSTISRFRSDLKTMNLYRKCFSELKRQIEKKGFELRSGKIIDARLVKAARRPGKDNEASFTKKGNKTVYGYKDHIAVDPRSEFVSEFVCTPANVHDSRVMEDLLEGEEKAIFADKAYDREAFKKACREQEKFYGILERARRNKQLSSKKRWISLAERPTYLALARLR